MTRRTVALSLIVLVVIAAFGVWSGRSGREHTLLREVYSPTFSDVPPAASLPATIEQIDRDLHSAAGQGFIARLLPDQAGVLWIALLVAIAVAFDFSRPRSWRNVDLILMLALGTMFFDMMRFFRIRLDPVYWRLLDTVFTVIFVLNIALLVRAVWHARSSRTRARWRPNIGGRPLAALALLLVASDVLVGLVREPDDAGFFINLGAQRLRERGHLPYGDPLLTGTPGAAYGPVLYAAHVPFQFIIERQSPNPVSNAHPPLGDSATYVLPPPLATRLCAITFHLAGILALFIAGRRISRSADVGWALVALYCGSAFVLGVGGTTELIGGMTFVSHIAPAAATLAAFACLPVPALAGALLAVSTGIGFYPAFILPAWAGYYWGDRAKCARFLAGFAVAAAIIGGSTWALSRPADGRGRIGTILSDTFGHHTDPHGYGKSPFGFWGQRTGVRKWMTTPLVGESGLTTPTYALLYVLVITSFAIARRAAPAQLALLTAAIAIAFSVIKIQPTGTYVAWAYPFLLIGIFAGAADGPVPGSSAHAVDGRSGTVA